jgi:hypothetical protein
MALRRAFFAGETRDADELGKGMHTFVAAGRRQRQGFVTWRTVGHHGVPSSVLNPMVLGLGEYDRRAKSQTI